MNPNENNNPTMPAVDQENVIGHGAPNGGMDHSLSYEPVNTPAGDIRARAVRVSDIINDGGMRLTAEAANELTGHLNVRFTPNPENTHWATAQQAMEHHVDSHRYARIYMGGRGSRIRHHRDSLRGLLSDDHRTFLDEDQCRKYMHAAEQLASGRDRPEYIYKIRFYDTLVQLRVMERVARDNMMNNPIPTMLIQPFREVTPRHPEPDNPLKRATGRFRTLLQTYDGSRGYMGIQDEIIAIYSSYRGEMRDD